MKTLSAAAVLLFMLTVTGTGTSYGAATVTPSKYHDRVVAAVNTVHAAERKLHKPKTPFAHNYTYTQAVVWGPRARMWHARLSQAQWVIPAVFGKSLTPQAMCIARAESGLDPKAYNSSSAAGLFQLMSFWYKGGSAYGWRFDPFDAWQNTLHAAMLYHHNGSWQAWTGDPCVS